MFAYVCPEALTKVVQDMKICPRYPPPKFSSSGGGLAQTTNILIIFGVLYMFPVI